MAQFKETHDAMNYMIHNETTSDEMIMAMSSNEKRGSGGNSHLRGVHQKENSTTILLQPTSEDSSMNGTTNPHSHNAQTSRTELLNPSSSEHPSPSEQQETTTIQQRQPPHAP